MPNVSCTLKSPHKVSIIQDEYDLKICSPSSCLELIMLHIVHLKIGGEGWAYASCSYHRGEKYLAPPEIKKGNCQKLVGTFLPGNLTGLKMILIRDP